MSNFSIEEHEKRMKAIREKHRKPVMRPIMTPPKLNIRKKDR